MEGKTQRNSAIELLRIISMVFIVMYHYALWGNASVWTASQYSFNTLFLQMFSIGGGTSNNVFLLISGYYMIKSGVRVKNILRLLAEQFFYAWTIAAILYGFHIVPFSIEGAIRAAVPIWFGYNWYVCCYIIFCCFVPFLNEYLHSISRQTYLRLLMVSLFLESFAYTFLATTYLSSDHSIDHFIVMYMIGGYIRLYGIECKHIKNWWHVFAVLAGLLELSVVILSIGGYLLKNDYIVLHATHLSGNSIILDVAVSVSLFQAVIHSKPFYNKHINTIAGSMVGIFLLHPSLLQQVIWGKIWPNSNYFHSPWLPLHMLVKVTAVFTVCLAIDLLRRRFLEPPFSRWLDRALATR